MSKSVIDSSEVKLFPLQLCYVVDDVKAAVEVCEKVFGWGPFNCFTADVEDASYRDWQGSKCTEVALGMAGAVQIEFLHMHKGMDAVAMYQNQYETGLQHIGIHCDDRDAAIEFLQEKGAVVNEINEYPGIRFAFVDVPTGEAMFELLQPTKDFDSSVVSDTAGADSQLSNEFDPIVVSRVTMVTNDIVKAAAFYATAFGWKNPLVTQATFELNDRSFDVKRLREKAGLLEIELIEPSADSECPYRQHLQRGDHGLVHAGAKLDDKRLQAILDALAMPISKGKWVDTNEIFSLISWLGGKNALQLIS